jgi:hypothetical protein
MSISHPTTPLLLLLATLALAGCDRAEAPAPTVANTATMVEKDDMIGRWVGVEGMVLDVAAAGAPGRYALTMQWDLDHRGRFDGTARSDTIVFTRDGVQETLRPTDGAATGLKYLADKKRCLTVKAGEGYCRA